MNDHEEKPDKETPDIYRGNKPKESASAGTHYEKWGANVRFGYGQPQPSSDAKKAGWARRRRNMELARTLLGLKFVGKVHKLDEFGNQMKDKDGNPIMELSPWAEKMRRYFGLSAEEVELLSNEDALMLRQIGEAIENGNQFAAESIMQRAYGKPKEFIEFEDEENQRPIINITVVAGLPDGTVMPDISESENDNNEKTESINGLQNGLQRSEGSSGQGGNQPAV